MARLRRPACWRRRSTRTLGSTPVRRSSSTIRTTSARSHHRRHDQCDHRTFRGKPVVVRPHIRTTIAATSPANVMLVGGAPLDGPRHMVELRRHRGIGSSWPRPIGATVGSRSGRRRARIRPATDRWGRVSQTAAARLANVVESRHAWRILPACTRRVASTPAFRTINRDASQPCSRSRCGAAPRCTCGLHVLGAEHSFRFCLARHAALRRLSRPAIDTGACNGAGWRVEPQVGGDDVCLIPATSITITQKLVDGQPPARPSRAVTSASARGSISAPPARTSVLEEPERVPQAPRVADGQNGGGGAGDSFGDRGGDGGVGAAAALRAAPGMPAISDRAAWRVQWSTGRWNQRRQRQRGGAVCPGHAWHAGDRWCDQRIRRERCGRPEREARRCRRVRGGMIRCSRARCRPPA